MLPEPDRRERLADEAAALAKQYPEADERPALYGVPVGVKDIVHVDGFTTRAGSALPPEHKPRLLRERPRTPGELPREAGMNYFEGQQRQFVRQLKVGKQIGEAEKPGGKAVQVYYLEGDERRAIRRFIEANEEIVAKALAQQVSRFQHEWSDFLYGLLEEEWRFWLCR